VPNQQKDIDKIHKINHPDTQYRVMDLVQKNPNITQRELARKLGISLGSMHYCLKALAQKGWLKAGNFKKNPKKIHYLYLLTAKGVMQKSMLAVDFLRRKQEEYHSLKKEIEELEHDINQ